jgi:hypothetical protein
VSEPPAPPPEGDGPAGASGAREANGAPDPGAPGSDLLSRLDPDRARADRAAGDHGDAAGSERGDEPAFLPAPLIDTRRYRWMIGIFGLVLVVAISIYQFATHGVGTTGVPPGQRLHYFAAPLADTDLNGDPNLSPPCTIVGHDPRALNICLLVRRAPLVLSFFVTGASQCIRQVDALQALSRRFPPGAVQFAAVAVDASHSSTAALVRSHRWTIPVAYDRDGSIGALYGIAVCPMVELALRGGVVADRLIGDPWQSSAELAPRVQALLQRSRAPSS